MGNKYTILILRAYVFIDWGFVFIAGDLIFALKMANINSPGYIYERKISWYSLIKDLKRFTFTLSNFFN